MSKMQTSPVCPGCESSASTPFYSVPAVPVHQVRLVQSRKAALACRKGDIALRFCEHCGFVWNAAFDASLMSYDEDYESTQTVSPTFNRFHERLARDLIGRFDLHGRTIVEVGCGQGEFITMLAEIGGNRGFGFDRVNRGDGGSPAVTFVKDFYGPAYAHLEPDFVCCKMTLEHVHDTGAFLRSMRHAIGDRPEAVIFLMIPEVTRILELRAFWDVYLRALLLLQPGRARPPLPDRRLRSDRRLVRLRQSVCADRREARYRQQPDARERAAGRGAGAQGQRVRQRRRGRSGALARLARAAPPAPPEDRALGRRLQGGGVPHHARHRRRDRLHRRSQPQALGHLHRRHRPRHRGARVAPERSARRHHRDEPDLPRRDQGPARRPGHPAGRARHRSNPSPTAPPPDTRCTRAAAAPHAGSRTVAIPDAGTPSRVPARLAANLHLPLRGQSEFYADPDDWLAMAGDGVER